MGAAMSSMVFKPPPRSNRKKDKFIYIPAQPEKDIEYIHDACGGADNPGIEENIMLLHSWLTKDDYEIPVVFLKRVDAKITILYSHGSTVDLGRVYSRVKELSEMLHANVLAYEYTGYGYSFPNDAAPSERMCYRNIESAYEYLTKDLGIPHWKIVLYGRSLGSGPSCYLAKKTADEGESVAGLILHSPFLSINRIVIDSKASLVGDMFNNKSRAKDVRCPVLIIHGTRDKIVPFWHGDELLRSFPEEFRAQPYWVIGLGHDHIETERNEEYMQRLSSFLKNYVIRLSNGIPVEEQYKPVTTLKESGKVAVNKTWMKHGLGMINEAINEVVKRKPNEESDEEPSIKLFQNDETMPRVISSSDNSSSSATSESGVAPKTRNETAQNGTKKISSLHSLKHKSMSLMARMKQSNATKTNSSDSSAEASDNRSAMNMEKASINNEKSNSFYSIFTSYLNCSCDTSTTEMDDSLDLTISSSSKDAGVEKEQKDDGIDVSNETIMDSASTSTDITDEEKEQKANFNLPMKNNSNEIMSLPASVHHDFENAPDNLLQNQFKGETLKKSCLVSKVLEENETKTVTTMSSLIAETDMSVVDPFAKQSTRMKKTSKKFDGDGDVWVEKMLTNKRTGKQKSFFYSMKSGERKADEPPSGSSRIIYLIDEECGV